MYVKTPYFAIKLVISLITPVNVELMLLVNGQNMHLFALYSVAGFNSSSGITITSMKEY